MEAAPGYLEQQPASPIKIRQGPSPLEKGDIQKKPPFRVPQ
jgi:hypothetical protein